MLESRRSRLPDIVLLSEMLDHMTAKVARGAIHEEGAFFFAGRFYRRQSVPQLLEERSSLVLVRHNILLLWRWPRDGDLGIKGIQPDVLLDVEHALLKIPDDR